MTHKDVPDSPARLMVELWRAMAAVVPSARSSAPVVDAAKGLRVMEAVEMDEAAQVAATLRAILASADAGERTGLSLRIMRELDLAFYRIHPRALMLTVQDKALPTWLAEAEEYRLFNSHYWADEADALVPNGPLATKERPEGASSGDSLPERFSAIALVRRTCTHEGRPLTVEHLLVNAAAAAGVRPSSSSVPGRESFAFLAVAEESADIELKQIECGSGHFVDYRATCDVSGRIIEGLFAVGDVDVCMAPELLVNEEQAGIANAQIKGLLKAPRLFIHGTGHTTSCDESKMHWNEATIVNDYGVELWRQRKVWPASIDEGRLVKLGLSPKGVPLYPEFNAGWSVIKVVDVEGFGRCVVLICQDLQIEPAYNMILNEYQPDWIFSPVFDYNVDFGRWASQRIAVNSGRAPTRYLVGTNGGYSLRLNNAPSSSIGLAVGPMTYEKDSRFDRAFSVLPPIVVNGRLIAQGRWGADDGSWEQWKLKGSKVKIFPGRA